MGMTERKMETQRRCGRQVTSEKSHHQRGFVRRPATLTQAMTIWEHNMYLVIFGWIKYVEENCYLQNQMFFLYFTCTTMQFSF